MSQYETFGDLKSQIAYKAGHGSLANAGSENEAAIGRCLNHMMRFLITRSNNRVLQKKAYFVTRAADTDTDQANATNGSTTVTFDSAVAAADMVGDDIVLNAGGIPYAIVGYTGTGEIEIFPAYAGTTFLAGAHTILSGHLKMPTDFHKALKMTDMTNDIPIWEMSLEKARRKLANPYISTTSRPTHYAYDHRLPLTTDPGAGSEELPYRLLLVPMPSSAITIMLDYVQLPAEMTSNATIPLIPAEHRFTLLQGGFMLYAEQYLNWDAARLQTTKHLFLEGIKQLSQDDKMAAKHTKFGSFMSGRPYGNIEVEEVDVYDDLMGNPWG